MKALVVILLLMANLPAFGDGAELFKVKFQVNRVYRDKDRYCFGNTAKGQAFVSGVIQNGKVVSAKLENFEPKEPYLPIYRSRALNADEVKSVELYRDKKGRIWMTGVEFSEGTLKWIAYESAARYSFCPVPQPIHALNPAPIHFSFETEGLEIGIWLSESNLVTIVGTRQDGNVFSGSLQFTQKLYFN